MHCSAPRSRERPTLCSSKEKIQRNNVLKLLQLRGSKVKEGGKDAFDCLGCFRLFTQKDLCRRSLPCELLPQPHAVVDAQPLKRLSWSFCPLVFSSFSKLENVTSVLLVTGISI